MIKYLAVIGGVLGLGWLVTRPKRKKPKRAPAPAPAPHRPQPTTPASLRPTQEDLIGFGMLGYSPAENQIVNGQNMLVLLFQGDYNDVKAKQSGPGWYELGHAIGQDGEIGTETRRAIDDALSMQELFGSWQQLVLWAHGEAPQPTA